MRMAGGPAPVHSHVGPRTRSIEGGTFSPHENFLLPSLSLSLSLSLPLSTPLTHSAKRRVRRERCQCLPADPLSSVFSSSHEKFHPAPTPPHHSKPQKASGCLTACRFPSCFSDNSVFVNRITNVLFLVGLGFIAHHCSGMYYINKLAGINL